MSKTNLEEFHIPFIKNLVFVGLVTIVSMISARFFIINSFHSISEPPVYTSQENGFDSK